MRSERKAEIKSVSFPQDRDRYRMEGSWHTIMGDKNKKDSELEAYHEKNTKVDGTSEYTCRGTEFSDCGRACRTGRSIFANDTQRFVGYQFSTAPSWCRADKKTEHRNTSSLYTKTERGDLPAASKKSL